MLRVLPGRIEARVAEGLGGFTGGVARFRRTLVDRNLEIAFPEKPRAERDRIALASYRHLVREGEHLLGSLLRPVDGSAVREQTRLADDETRETFDWLRDRSARNEPTVLLTGHLGNWEMMGASIPAHGVPMHAVAVGQRNPLFDARLRRMRSELGLQIISRDAAKDEVPGVLKSGGTVGLVADQYSQRGVAVEFFGRPVRAARGPAVFAQRYGAAAALGVALRDPGWPPRYSVFLHRLRTEAKETQGKPRGRVSQWTQAYLQALEGFVRRFPEQYLWLHNRWRD